MKRLLYFSAEAARLRKHGARDVQIAGTLMRERDRSECPFLGDRAAGVL